MKKLVSITCVFIFSILGLVGCGDSDEVNPPTNPDKKVPKVIPAGEVKFTGMIRVEIGEFIDTDYYGGWNKKEARAPKARLYFCADRSGEPAEGTQRIRFKDFGLPSYRSTFTKGDSEPPEISGIYDLVEFDLNYEITGKLIKSDGKKVTDPEYIDNYYGKRNLELEIANPNWISVFPENGEVPYQSLENSPSNLTEGRDWNSSGGSIEGFEVNSKWFYLYKTDKSVYSQKDWGSKLIEECESQENNFYLVTGDELKKEIETEKCQPDMVTACP